MIRKLRRRHRRMIAVLCVVAPAIFVAGLAARRSAPVTPVPLAIADPGPPLTHLIRALPHLFSSPPIDGRLLADTAPPTRAGIELLPMDDPREPDLLVYWSRDPADSNPVDAQLIGSMDGRRRRVFVLPDDALDHGGALLLYSLAHQKLVAAAPLPSAGSAP